MKARALACTLTACLAFDAAAEPPPSPADVLIAEGRIAAGGLEGTWSAISDRASGAYAVRTDLGAYALADIYDGRSHWRVEPSGGSHALDSAFAERATSTEAWLARFGWLAGDFGAAARSAPADRTEDGRRYTVLTATPAGGLPIELWFDAATGTLARAIRPTWFQQATTLFSDYRDAAGRRLPFAITNRVGENEERIAVTAYRTAARPPAGSFAAPRQPDDATIPAGGTTVPIVVFPQLAIEATLNGRPMTFIFDTGGHSILTPEAAQLLGLKPVGGQQTGGSGAGTLLQQDTRVAEVRIGDATLRDQHFYVLSMPYGNVERGPNPPFAGLLGLEILERFTMRLDYRAGKATLLPRDRPPACNGVWRTARFTDDMPTVDAKLDGLEAAFTIDTGNNNWLMLYRYWLEQNGVVDRYDRGVETLTYGAGGGSRNWVSYAQTFQVGAEVIPKPMVRTTDDKAGVALSLSEAGNLGTALLANYTITFDYARSRVCFDYVPGYVPVPFNRAGIRTIKTDPDQFLVTLVNEGSPAWDAGLRKDDRIVALQGKPARALGSGDLTLALTQPPGTRVSLRTRRNGEERDVVIELRDMLK